MDQLELDQYFNTNKETGETLKQSTKNANRQDNLILDFFRQNPDKWFARYQIENRVFKTQGHNVPLTSVQRSLTNLTNAEYLIKSDEPFIEGNYGKMVHGWKLNEEKV